MTPVYVYIPVHCWSTKCDRVVGAILRCRVVHSHWKCNRKPRDDLFLSFILQERTACQRYEPDEDDDDDANAEHDLIMIDVAADLTAALAKVHSFSVFVPLCCRVPKTRIRRCVG